MKILPKGERVVVEPFKKEDEFSLPDHLTKDALILCKTVEVSEDIIKGPKEGDILLVPKNALRAITSVEGGYSIVNNKDINAIITF
jgi:co-chaperonin GroES (HSP10)